MLKLIALGLAIITWIYVNGELLKETFLRREKVKGYDQTRDQH